MRWLIIVLSIFLSIASAANAQIGTVTVLDGNGFIKRDKEIVGDRKGTSVEQMDVAETTKGRMQIDFVDETRLDVIDNSRIVIDEFVYDPNTGKGSLDIRASLGAVRYASGQIAKNSRQNVRLRTPTATISVRGTDFNMLVNEIGESYVTLLPSCEYDGNGRELECVTGEISVENDAGIVILNQAFQMTRVTSLSSPPSKPIVVDLTEPQITGMLIVRRTDPIEQAEQIQEQQSRETDFLAIDFLEFDALDKDVLGDDIKDIWVTELDKGADYYLRELLVDMIDVLNAALAELFRDELDKQNEQLMTVQQTGYDEKTGVFFDVDGDRWHVRREDASVENYLDLYLHNGYGYSINMEQGDEAVYDYRLGVGSNTIDIQQR
jgi:hypothetical protein